MSDDLRAALYDCGLAAHFGGQAMDRKTRGGREKLAYIERRAAAALTPPEPAPEVNAAWEALCHDDELPPLREDAARVIRRHRPRIEAAMERLLRERGWRDEYEAETDAAMNHGAGIAEAEAAYRPTDRGRGVSKTKFWMDENGTHWREPVSPPRAEVRAAAVAALAVGIVTEADAAAQLRAMEDYPDRARALIAALLTEEALAAAMARAFGLFPSSSGNRKNAAAILRALTEADTRSKP